MVLVSHQELHSGVDWCEMQPTNPVPFKSLLECHFGSFAEDVPEKSASATCLYTGLHGKLDVESVECPSKILASFKHYPAKKKAH